MLEDLVDRDEAKAEIYDRVTGDGIPLTPDEVVDSVSAKLGKPRSWVREMYGEMERDPVLNSTKIPVSSKRRHALSPNAIANLTRKTTAQSKAEFFGLLDKAHEEAGLLGEDGKPKSHNRIARETGINLAGRFNRLRGGRCGRPGLLISHQASLRLAVRGARTRAPWICVFALACGVLVACPGPMGLRSRLSTPVLRIRC